jgi:hypothetical protein
MRYALFALTLIIAGTPAIKQLSNNNSPHYSRVLPHQSIVVETATDSTRPADQMSAKEKMDAHVIHFTGAVMSDTFVISHFSKAFVSDQYSDFLKPGKYTDGSASLPKSIATSLDGIAIPKKTRLIVYGKPHLTGMVLLDVIGPIIVNNNIFESSDFYAVANKKNYSRQLQELFPQKLRRWTDGGSYSMSSWQSFSFEISVVL